VERSFSEQEVLQFGNLIHDWNPLHQAWQPLDLPNELNSHPLMAKAQEGATTTTQAIVHGMFLSSLFSSIFGTLVPGAVYMNQTLQFRSPVFVDEHVVGKVEITRVKNFKGHGVIVTCDTRVLQLDDRECVTGKADVWLPSGSKL
jgi:predicted membrane GTPase involved in stress response